MIWRLLLLSVISLHTGHAQTVTLSFPHFGGKDWVFVLMAGTRSDTVQYGTLSPDGRGRIALPESYASYTGMARWMLRDGGGLDILLNGTSLSVTCLSDKPTMENIHFEGAADNDFFVQYHHWQEAWRRQYEAIQGCMQAYVADSRMHDICRQENTALLAAFAEYEQQLARSALYGARFREIVDYTRGMIHIAEKDEHRKALFADQYLRTRLSWPALYTSGHWAGVCHSWIQLHVQAIQSDSLLKASALDILSRIDDPVLYTEFCTLMVRNLIKYGKDELIMDLSARVLGSGRLLHREGILSLFGKFAPGALAPKLLNRVGDTLSWPSENRAHLLLFYQSGCGPCTVTLTILLANYANLRKAGVGVISISADTDEKAYFALASTFPWADKLGDFKGFSGPNFLAYGVVGTPTILLLNQAGKILSRRADLQEILIWLDTH